MFKTFVSSSVLSGFKDLDPIKHVLQVFWMASKTFLEKCVSREFITMMFLWTLEISIWEKHKTPYTNKEEVLSGFKTIARDILSTIW